MGTMKVLLNRIRKYLHDYCVIELKSIFYRASHNKQNEFRCVLPDVGFVTREPLQSAASQIIFSNQTVVSTSLSEGICDECKANESDFFQEKIINV